MAALALRGEAAPRLAPGATPACTTCADADPALLEDGRTACCNAAPVACTCPDCGTAVYYTPGGDTPDHCPHCPHCP